MKKYRLFLLVLLLLVVTNLFSQKNKNEYFGIYPGTPRYYPSTDSLNGVLRKACERKQFWGFFPSHFSPTKNVNDTTRKYLLAMLNWEISKEELEKKVDEYIANLPYKYAFNHKFWGGGLHDTIVNKVGFYAMDFDSLYHVYYDSLKLTYRDEVRKKIRESSIKKIPDDVVLSVAKAQIKEAIPIIKKDLLATVKRFDTNTSFLALAILGDNYYLDKMYKEHEKKIHAKNLQGTDIEEDIRTLDNIYTPKSISLIVDWIDTSKVLIDYRNLKKKSYASEIVLPYFLQFIKDENFNKEYVKFWAGKKYIDFYDVDEKQILFVRDWLKKKGNKFKFYLP